MLTGPGDRRYRPLTDWEDLPSGWSYADVAGVAVDAQDRVYALTRNTANPVLVFEPDGRFLRTFGQGVFGDRTHGITVGPDGTVYCVDEGAQVVYAFTPEGELRATIGTVGQASDTGYDGRSLASIARGGPPFNRPTNLAVAPNGDLYVSDGYGNARVHRFTPDGRLVHSWGEPGTGPG